MFIHVVDKTISMIKQYVYSSRQDKIIDKTICLFVWWTRQNQ